MTIILFSFGLIFSASKPLPNSLTFLAPCGDRIPA